MALTRGERLGVVMMEGARGPGFQVLNEEDHVQ